MIRRTLLILIACTIAFCVYVQVMGDAIDHAARQAQTPAACAEDDPCWDCSTMGNLQCGPTGR